MLKLVQVTVSQETSDTLTLPYDQRRKSRFLAVLGSGRACGAVLPRGTSLKDGDVLLAEDGTKVRVSAAAESLSVARTSDVFLLTRAAYHLGNRHVNLQIGSGELRYQHDHVLDEMVVELGLAVSVEQLSFEPESGAYSSNRGGNSHAHSHHQH